jgi:hypothetical protein
MVEVARSLAISWRWRGLDLLMELRAMMFANESVSMPPRQVVSLALGRASSLLSGTRLEVQSVSMALPRWSDFVLLHRVEHGLETWTVAG